MVVGIKIKELQKRKEYAEKMPGVEKKSRLMLAKPFQMSSIMKHQQTRKTQVNTLLLKCSRRKDKS